MEDAEMAAQAATSSKFFSSDWSPKTRAALGTIQFLGLAFGVPLKLAMFRYLWRSPRGHGHSIDSLITLDQAVNSLNLFIVLGQIANVVLKAELVIYPLSDLYCAFNEWAFFLDVSYRAIGNLGIASFRFMYIKAHNSLLRVGETRTRKFITWFGLLSATGLATAHIFEYVLTLDPYEMFHFNNCMGRSYFHFDRRSRVDKGIAIVSMLCPMAELYIYLSIFWDQRKYNKRSSRGILKDKQSVVRRRRRVNAVTTLGHFASWLMKISQMMIALICHFAFREEDYGAAIWVFFYLLPTCNFVVYSFVQTLGSDPLKRELAKLLGCRELKALRVDPQTCVEKRIRK